MRLRVASSGAHSIRRSNRSASLGKDLRKVAGRGQCPWHKPAYLGIVFSRLFHPEGENHEDASCCRHSCDGARSPRSGEGEAGAIDAGAIGTPARLSVVGATRLLPRLPSE
jgi:hypothetical protein